RDRRAGPACCRQRRVRPPRRGRTRRWRSSHWQTWAASALDQPGVRAAGVLQRPVRAALGGLATFEQDDFIGITDGAEPMCDDEAGAAAAPQVIVDCLLGAGVERAGGLI